MNKLTKATIMIALSLSSYGCKSQLPPTDRQRVEFENSTQLSSSPQMIVEEVVDMKNEPLKVGRGINGSWACISDVDFSIRDYKSIKIRASKDEMYNDYFVEVRVGSIDGELLAKVPVIPTARCKVGAPHDFISHTKNILFNPKAQVDLYFKFICPEDKFFEVDWVELSSDEVDENKVRLVDFFRPMELQGELISTNVWGHDNVLPRDINNGLESSKLHPDWCYWDGGIVKSDDGKYHIYATRWPGGVSHSDGWKLDANPRAMHAVSDNVEGPYTDLGEIYDYKEGMGCNINPFRLHDGRYAVVSSERSNGDIFISDNPEGPFKHAGEIIVDQNGYPISYSRYTHEAGRGRMSNVRIKQHPNGRSYMMIVRSCALLISEDNPLGPYKIVAPPVHHNREDLADAENEDATLWYSGGYYNIVYNHWPSKTMHHFTSKNGIDDWIYRGEAYNKGLDKIFRYTDGTINEWFFIETPNAFVEDNHVTHFTFAVLDVKKGDDLPNDNHGSKIAVVPFDGVAFDKYVDSLYNTTEN